MKPNHLLHRFLTLALAGLLLLLHSGNQTLHGLSKATAATPKQATKKATKTPDSATIVKAATDEAVVAPALSFDFSQVTYLLPAPCFRLLALHQPLLRRVHEVPYFYFSYLRYVFGHFIAPNAP